MHKERRRNVDKLQETILPRYFLAERKKMLKKIQQEKDELKYRTKTGTTATATTTSKYFHWCYSSRRCSILQSIHSGLVLGSQYQRQKEKIGH